MFRTRASTRVRREVLVPEVGWVRRCLARRLAVQVEVGEAGFVRVVIGGLRWVRSVVSGWVSWWVAVVGLGVPGVLVAFGEFGSGLVRARSRAARCRRFPGWLFSVPLT